MATSFIPYKFEKTVCPFGVRDLSKDECYSGSGLNRCSYFVRYVWGDPVHNQTIECTCDKAKKITANVMR